ncbi:MAG: glycosyltransferase family 4 protein [Geminicoccaceae bacterium]
MRLLQVLADGRPGGGTTHVLQLIEQLAPECEGDIHLVSENGSYALGRAAKMGIASHGLPFMEGGRFDPRTWRDLRRLVADLAPDLIHAHGARAALPLVFPWRRAGTPLIYTVHGYHFPPKQRGLRTLGRLAERWCSARADATVFVCEHDRRIAERHGILARCRRHQVIHNGIATEGLPAAATRDDRLVFAGRLVEQKNPLMLVDVLDRLRPERVRLLVIGDGPLQAAMRRRASEMGVLGSIEFRGAVPHESALQALAGGGILVLPSLSEGLPLVVLEAMAIGLPVVAAGVGGVPEIIEHGETGLLVDRQAPESYAQSVRLLLRDPDLRAGLIARARRRVAECFSWAAAKHAYLELYRNILRQADSCTGPSPGG